MILLRERVDAPPGGRPVIRGVTDAVGGASTGACAGFNLGGHVGDDPDAVAQNRAELAATIPVERDRLLFMRQVHGAEVATVEGPWVGEPPEVDAMVTTTPGLALAVLVADCVPVLLHDAVGGVVGVAHAGRAGLVAGVVPQTVARMRGLGADDIGALVGPSICGRCYEVPEDLRAQAAAASPVSAAVTRRATPAIDVAAGVIEQLVDSGVERTAIAWAPECTLEDERLYSYRRDPATGRFAGFVALEGDDPAATGARR